MKKNLSFVPETLEEFLSRVTVVTQSSNRTSVRVTMPIYVCLAQIRDDRQSLLYFHTAVMQYGANKLTKNFVNELATNHALMRDTRNHEIDFASYDIDDVFGAGWAPDDESKKKVQIQIKPCDALASDIGKLSMAVGARSSWIQRCCFAEAIILSDHIVNGKPEQSVSIGPLVPYVEHFRKRLDYRNARLQAWIDSHGR